MLEELRSIHPADARVAGGMERGNLEVVSMCLGLFGPMALVRLPWFSATSEEMCRKLGPHGMLAGSSNGGTSGCGGGGGDGGGGCGGGDGGGCGGS